MIQICAMIGPGKIPSHQDVMLRHRLSNELDLAIQRGCSVFLCGFQGEVDLLFARLVLERKRLLPHLFLEAAIPYGGYLASASPQVRELLRQCGGIAMACPEYRFDCMHHLSRYVALQSHRIIAVVDGASPRFVENTLRYARVLGRTVRIIPG